MPSAGINQVCFGGRHPSEPAHAAILVAVTVFECQKLLLARLPKRAGARFLVRDNEIEHVSTDHIIGCPAEDTRECWVYGLQHSQRVTDELHILRVTPKTVAFLRSFGYP